MPAATVSGDDEGHSKVRDAPPVQPCATTRVGRHFTIVPYGAREYYTSSRRPSRRIVTRPLPRNRVSGAGRATRNQLTGRSCATRDSRGDREYSGIHRYSSYWPYFSPPAACSKLARFFRGSRGVARSFIFRMENNSEKFRPQLRLCSFYSDVVAIV